MECPMECTMEYDVPVPHTPARASGGLSGRRLDLMHFHGLDGVISSGCPSSSLWPIRGGTPPPPPASLRRVPSATPCSSTCTSTRSTPPSRTPSPWTSSSTSLRSPSTPPSGPDVGPLPTPPFPLFPPRCSIHSAPPPSQKLPTNPSLPLSPGAGSSDSTGDMRSPLASVRNCAAIAGGTPHDPHPESLPTPISPPFVPRAAGPLGTKEQLGYTVSATMVQQHPPGFNLSSYRVLVQSGDYGPEYLAHGRPFPCVRQVRWGMGV